MKSKTQTYSPAVVCEDEAASAVNSRHYVLNNGTRKAVFSNELHEVPAAETTENSIRTFSVVTPDISTTDDGEDVYTYLKTAQVATMKVNNAWKPITALTYDYLYLSRTSTQRHTVRITIRKSNITIPDAQVTDVRLVLRTYSDTTYANQAKIDVNGTTYTHKGNADLVLDLTSAYLAQTSDVVFTMQISEDCVNFDRKFQKAPVLEINYVPATTSHVLRSMPLLDDVTAELDAVTGSALVVVDDLTDPELNISIAHIFRQDESRTTYGAHFRLNLDETLTYLQNHYVYTDPMGIQHTFEKRFYYINSEQAKIYLAGSAVDAITVDATGRLFYNEQEVFLEWCTNDGLTATARLDGIRHSQYFEQRQDQEKQLAERVRAYQDVVCKYRVALKENGQDMGDIQSGALDDADTLEAFLAYAQVEGRLLFASEEERLSYCSLLQQKQEKELLLTQSTSDDNTDTTDDSTTLINQSLALLNAQITLMQNKSAKNLSELQIMYTEFSSLNAQYVALMQGMPVAYLITANDVRGFNEKGELVAIQDNHGRCTVLEREVYNKAGDTRLLALCDTDGNRKVRFTYNTKNRLSEITDSAGTRRSFTYNQDGSMKLFRRDARPALHFTYSSDGSQLTSVYYIQPVNGSRAQASFTYETSTGRLTGVQIGDPSEPEPLENAQIAYTSDCTTVSEQDGEQTAYIVDRAKERLLARGTSLHDYLTSAERYTYDKNGRCIQIDYLDKKETYMNGAAFAGEEFARNRQETTTYNSFGDPIATTSEENVHGYMESNSTTLTYNESRQLTQQCTIRTCSPATGSSQTERITEKFFYNGAGDLVRKETDSSYVNGIDVEEYTYTAEGYLSGSCSYNTEDPSSRLYSEEVPDAKGRTVTLRDVTGQYQTTRTYTPRGLVHIEKRPNGSSFGYGYAQDGTLKSITQNTAEGEENSTIRTYENGCLTELRGGDHVVSYTYDSMKRRTGVTMDGASYVTYDYATDNEKNETVTATLANGTVMRRTENKFGEVTETSHGSAATAEDSRPNVTYTYDEQHRLTGITDSISGSVAYTYNANGDTTAAQQDNMQEQYTYDAFGRVSVRATSSSASTLTHRYTYTYRTPTGNEPSSIAVAAGTGNVRIEPQQDALGRDTGKKILYNNVAIGEERVSYLKYGDHATRLPSVIRYAETVNGTTAFRTTEKYVYDNMGNIAGIEENGRLVCRYTYDALGRLSREDDSRFGFSRLYTYDRNGNILARHEYMLTAIDDARLKIQSSPTAKFAYVYDANNGRLLSYNGQSCVYDLLGNPTTYCGKTAVWENGRQLTQFDGTTFTYDARGRRIGKGDIQFIYDANGRLEYQSNNLAFLYDHTGVCGFRRNASIYMYRKNAMNDVIALLNMSGAVVAQYQYDAWGNCKVLDATGAENTSSTFIGNVNPFRYRSYYFDTETGLYFLQSRYYDPKVGRFLSMDDFSYLDPDHANGMNLYAYCNNDPINYADPSGSWAMPSWLKILIGVAVIAGLLIGATFAPGIAGVILGAAFYSALTSAVSGAVVSGIIGGITAAVTGQNFFIGLIDGMADGFMWGAIIGGATGAILSGFNFAVKGVKLVGTAQKTKHLFHQFASNVQAGKMSMAIGKYSSIYVDRSRGLQIKGFRPDVTGQAKDGLHVVEVVSSSQTYQSQVNKIVRMQGVHAHVTHGLVLDEAHFFKTWFIF